MAKLTKGILGPVEGKIGTVIGSSWKGIPYIKSAPASYENYKPKTAAKIASVKKFQFLNALLVPFYTFIGIGFKNQAGRRTEINAAFSENYHSAVLGEYPDLAVDYSKLILSKGDLFVLSEVECRFLSADTLQVTWAASLNPPGRYEDQLMLVVYSEALKTADGFVGGTKRNQGQCRFAVHPKFLGHALEVYISVFSADFKKVSNTQYLGRKEPL